MQAETAGSLPRYNLTATLEPGDRRLPARISGQLTLILPEPGTYGESVYLRLYPNAPGYGDGGMILSDVSVDGVAVVPELSAESTVAAIPLGSGWQPGHTAEITVRFVSDVPVHSRTGFGMYSVKPESGAISLAHWYPMLAGIGPSGPEIGLPSAIGDPVFSLPALYDVWFDAPAELAIVGAGWTVDREVSGDVQRLHIVAGPAREFPIVAGTDWQALTIQAGDVTIRSWAPSAQVLDSQRIAEWAAAALDSFGRRFGSYPFRELDLVQMDLFGAAGMEFPGLVLLDPSNYLASTSERRFSEMVVAHEVAHQWWYGIVVNDQNIEAFIDEGLSEYAAVALYFGDRYGPDEADAQMDLLVESWVRSALESNGDEVVDRPTDAYRDRSSYS
ncbi:MAG: M1 family aminopeptidase, partial [Thermomicrobiales bacterium]